MTEPTQQQLVGPPHRPLQLFIAYRLKDAYAEIQAAMAEARIACELETEEGARGARG